MAGTSTRTTARATAAGTQWDVAAASLTLLVLSAAFLVWRMGTPASCAAVGPDAGAWRPGGVVVSARGNCPLPSAAVVSAHAEPPAIALGFADGRSVALGLADHARDLASHMISGGWTLLFVVSTFLICAIVFLRNPGDRSSGAPMVFASGLLGGTVVSLAGLPVDWAFSGWARWLFLIVTQGGSAVVWGAALLSAVLFPTPLTPTAGRLADRIRIGAAPLGIWALLTVVILLASHDFTALFHYSARANAVVTTFAMVATVVVLFVRVSRMRDFDADAVARQQLLWLGASGASAVMVELALWVVPSALTGNSLAPYELAGAPGLVFVAGLAISLFRWGMFELEWLLVKVLVLTTLILLATGVYHLVAWAFRAAGISFGAADAGLVAVIVATVVATPLRARVERAANWVVYRDTTTPYATLSGVAKHLAGRNVDFGGVAADIGRALRVPRVEIRSPAVAAAAGASSRVAASQPVGFPVSEGELVVWTRGRGDRFTAAETHLLRTIAGQIGAAVAQVRLTDELRRSREQLLLTREEERRALRRVLHDDIAPTLAGITLQAETARRLLGRDPAAVADVLVTVGRDAQAASRQVRALSYDLRPAALDDRGLLAALADQQTRLAPTSLVVDGSGIDQGTPLPAAVEAAAFRIAIEAMANVARHAGASTCWVRMSRSPGELTLEVADDGIGLRAGFRPGVGMGSMQDRAAELGGSCEIGPRPGGGTRVMARLPLEAGHE